MTLVHGSVQRHIQVLWIDDELGVVEGSRNRLAANGIDVDHALDGQSGLELALARTHDLIILDERMPGMSGLEVLEAIRHEEIQTPIIMLTAYACFDSACRAGALGAVRYFQKPLVGEDLVVAILGAVLPSWAKRPQEAAPRLGRGQQTTWRPSPSELVFLDRLAERWGVSRNVALRRIVRAAMSPKRK